MFMASLMATSSFLPSLAHPSCYYCLLMAACNLEHSPTCGLQEYVELGLGYVGDICATHCAAVHFVVVA